MFSNKIVNIVFSVLVAIGLWVYVVGEINPETTGKFEDIPVRFINASVLAEDGLAIVDPGEMYVSVTVSGTRADINGLRESEIDVTANLTGQEKGENQIELKVSLPNDIKLQNLSSEKVRVTIEAMVTAEKPVQIQYEGTIPAGKEPGAISISPQTIQVRGAESSVDETKYVAATIPITGINGTPQELEAELTPIDKNAEPISYLFLSQEQVRVEVALLDLKTVPLQVNITGNVPNGYVLEDTQKPETITIKGTTEALSKIDSMTATPIDISKEKESVSIPIQPVLPAGIEVANVSSNVTLQLTINMVTVKTFTYDEGSLDFTGLAAGLAIDIPTQSILLAVESSADISSGLVAGDFTLSLNLEGLKAGSHKVSIKVETPKTGLTYSTTPKEIQINIREE